MPKTQFLFHINYGCFDVNQTPKNGADGVGWNRALVNEAGNNFEFDPLTGALYYLSSSCTGSGAVGLPAVSCVTDRIVVFRNGGGWFLDLTPMIFSAIAESEEPLAARRDDQHSQVGAQVVEITTVLVPEPSAAALWISGS